MRRIVPRRARTPAALLCLVALGGAPACEGDRAEPAETPAGWWRPARDALTDEQRAALDKLDAIGYAGGTREASGSFGVTIRDAERTSPGFNLFTSGHAAEAILMRSDGTVVHRWAREFRAVWPDSPAPPDHLGVPYWRRVHVFENGDLLAIHEGLGLVKLDRESEVLWAAENGAHHDLDVLPNGEIWVLTRETGIVARIHETEPVVEDFLTVLDAEGRELRRISLLEAFERSSYEKLWYASRFRAGDMFHTNTLEVLDGSLADRLPEFRRGHVLTAMRHLDVVAVVDPDRIEVVWAKRGDFRRMHDPTILEDGRLLLFNNDFPSQGSSVLELDPATMQSHWEYHGTDEAPFYTEWCGAAQRLPNGNTLITESDAGRAFEVTRDGEIVWEFVNTHRAGPRGELIAATFEMVRLPPDFPVDWASSDAPRGP